MKIAMLPDLHEHFPFIQDDVDMVVFNGDFCCTPSAEEKWVKREAEIWTLLYGPYMQEIRSRGIKVVGCPGNHDFYPQSSKSAFQHVASFFDVFVTRGYRNILGYSWYFFCYNRLEEYSYYLNDSETRKRLDQFKTRQVDFVVTHTPAYDILSMVPDWGSMPIRHFVERVRPKHCHMFGHCHSDFGYTRRDGVTHVNASYSMAENHPRYEYMVYDTESRTFELVRTHHTR